MAADLNFVQILEFSAGFWFSLLMLLAGAFTAYFGSGKSRAISALLILVGAGVAFACWWFWWQTALNVLLMQILVVVGAIVGAAAAMAIFMVAIMKM